MVGKISNKTRLVGILRWSMQLSIQPLQRLSSFLLLSVFIRLPSSIHPTSGLLKGLLMFPAIDSWQVCRLTSNCSNCYETLWCRLLSINIFVLAVATVYWARSPALINRDGISSTPWAEFVRPLFSRSPYGTPCLLHMYVVEGWGGKKHDNMLCGLSVPPARTGRRGNGGYPGSV